ncbi:MAG: ABC transporter substrate-binding protein [Lachnospiraceae bacterium]|nr:ABC transporter substrate-binding protein [Lachnospiraceae bacterium]
MTDNIKKCISIFSLTALSVISLVGCANSNDNIKDKTEKLTEKIVDENKTLTVLNYGEYIDRDVLKTFQEETGIKVLYEEATTPEEMYAKYKGGAIDYDLICTSEYMIEKLMGEDELMELDKDSMEYYDNIDERYLKLSESFDPGNKYSIPYFFGTIGLLYNTEKVNGPVDTWEVLFNGEYSGEIIMQNSIRDAYMCALKYKGYSLNTTNRDELDEAQKMLIDQKKDVEAYFVDEVREEMVAENAAIAVCYSGEAYLANEYNSDLQFVVPKEGSNLWIDSWCITKNCRNYEGANKFLDFLCREDVAYLNFEEVYYPTPNKAVFENLDEEEQEDPLIFPSEDALNNCEVYKILDAETTEYMGEMWKELKVLQ